MNTLRFIVVALVLCLHPLQPACAANLPKSKQYKVDPINDTFSAAGPAGKPITCAVIQARRLVIAGTLVKARLFARYNHTKIVRLRRAYIAATSVIKRESLRRKLLKIGRKRDALDTICQSKLSELPSSSEPSSSSSSSQSSRCQETEICDLADNDCDGIVDEGCCPGGPYQGSETLDYCPDAFYGMQLDSAQGNINQVTIETTGARYVLSQDRMDMWRRIDPASNTDNPRLVAQLAFNEPIGPLVIEYSHKRSAVVSSEKAIFTFNSDSFFFVEAQKEFSYTHLNLIALAPWNRGSNLDRMWTDGFGGSLHANVRNPPSVNGDTDSSTFNLAAGQRAAHMVFPPKPFDFAGLYGESARPFVHTIGGLNKLMEPFITRPATFDTYLADGFATFLVWNQIYISGDFGPMLLESGIMGYKILENAEQTVRDFLSAAHQKGIKVIFYAYTPSTWRYPAGHPKAGQTQAMEITLEWMRQFRESYGFDGWYLDNGNAGDLVADYDFMRQLRSDVGPDGIIYHHDSVDVWGHYSGLRAIMVDAYVNYTLTGETGTDAMVDEPNNPYFRFFSAGYGMSQTYSAHTLRSRMDVAISEQEKNRVMTYNLHGAERSRTSAWLSHGKPSYLARKSEYLSGTLQAAPTWPLDLQSSWFRTPQNVTLQWLSGTSVRISWETEQAADSELACTSNGVWWDSQYDQDGPEKIVQESALDTQHSAILSYLKPNTNYEYRIRSNNRAGGVSEVIWGQLGTFSTTSADNDGDNMGDDWELEHFGGLSRSGNGDYENDSVSDLNEYLNGTHPNLPDTDFDAFPDYYEIQIGSDPLDWNAPPAACNHNMVCQDGQSGETVINCPSDCKENLVASWSFEHGQAWDASGNRYHGTAHGGAWISENGTGHSSVYEMVDDWFPDYIDLPSSLAAPSLYGGSTGNISITAWVKIDDPTQYNVIAFNLGGVYYFSAGSSTSPGKLMTMVRNVASNANYWPVSNAPITPGEWTHVAFILEGGLGYRFFINGQLDKAESNSSLALYDYELLATPGLGKGTSGLSYFNGRLDDVTLWKKALSHQEVCELGGFTWSGGACQN